MPTTAFGLADFDAALKEVVQPYIQDNLPKSAKLLQVIKRNEDVEFFNDNFYAPIRTSRHGGIVNLATDKGKLRTGNSGYGRLNVGQKIMTGTFDISDVVKKASANQKGAVENAITRQMKDLKNDFARSINRQYWSDGYGVVGQVSGSVGAGTLSIKYPDTSLDDGRVTNYYGTINGDIKPTKYLTIGQAIGIGTAGADVGTVSSISYTSGSLGTVVVTGAPAIVAEDSIYLVDGDEIGAGTSEIQGIRLALSTGTADYAGTARSVEVMAPQYLGTASNAALTVNDMETVYMSAVEYAQEGDKFAWFVNKTLYIKYGDLLTALRRIVNKTELVSGWSGLAFEAGQGEVAVYLDYDTPDGEAILLNLDTWTVCQITDMGFVEDNSLRRSDYITFQKVFSWYTNLLCKAPAANGRLVRRTK
jgi:hypothetical protein